MGSPCHLAYNKKMCDAGQSCSCNLYCCFTFRELVSVLSRYIDIGYLLIDTLIYCSPLPV